MEFGGYIELDTYRGKMLHKNAVKLNCGRNALVYLAKSKKISKIWIPKFICHSLIGVLTNYNIDYEFYKIDKLFRPKNLSINKNDYILIINYYGQLSNSFLLDFTNFYPHTIVDNTQAYYQEPLKNVDTFYSCRKYFGVPDGAILYTDKLIKKLSIDKSYKHMNFLLGRYEESASSFYHEYVANNKRFENEMLKKMSTLTENLLHAIDYNYVKEVRTNNYKYLHTKFRNINILNLSIPVGPFMYPLLIENGYEIRDKLLKNNIYIPLLWPNVLLDSNKASLEYNYAINILPLPIDQRYTIQDMKTIANTILNYLN